MKFAFSKTNKSTSNKSVPIYHAGLNFTLNPFPWIPPNQGSGTEQISINNLRPSPPNQTQKPLYTSKNDRMFLQYQTEIFVTSNFKHLKL